jgi:hypothetical protein
VENDTPLSHRLVDYVYQSRGWFFTRDVCQALHLKEEKDTTNVRVQLHKLADKGLLERDNKVNGHWRKVEDEFYEMDLVNADKIKPLDVKYPFGIERVFPTLPRSILVCAGSSNSGKTAFMLNFCLLNQWKHHVVYFSSEMGASRLKARLSKHPLYISDGIGFQAFERGDNFADAVGKFPTSLIVIDYLEIYDNFYEIGAKIKAIFDKLQGNGVCFIAVQKNPSRKNLKGQTEYVDLGRGGNFGLEKASLYLVMDSAGKDGHSRLKIVKAKEWAHENINPNGMEWGYKLVNGCSFVQVQDPDGLPIAPEIVEINLVQEEMPF